MKSYEWHLDTFGEITVAVCVEDNSFSHSAGHTEKSLLRAMENVRNDTGYATDAARGAELERLSMGLAVIREAHREDPDRKARSEKAEREIEELAEELFKEGKEAAS